MFKTVIGAWLFALVAVIGTKPRAAAQQVAADGPQLQADGTAAFPADYREWIFLSAGLGMNYGPNAPAAGAPQSFTNVYVNPSSYRAFMKSGAWPDRTMFILEIRGSASEGSINKAGHYQTDVRAIEANIKDARLPGGWGFYNFGNKSVATAPLPQSASCYTCHAEHTAVEHTFVQFYPALMDVARKMGTVRPSYKEGQTIR
ncbi:MAG TPA: cytochrome P460 family protein [Vicinamibacterales bacterium]|nr:cytochrome P460 family protein [Vicinamibacterales bacterium]